MYHPPLHSRIDWGPVEVRDATETVRRFNTGREASTREEWQFTDLPALIIRKGDIPDSNLWSGHRNSLEAKISSLHSMRRPPSLASMTPKSPAYLFLARGDEAMLGVVGNSCLAFWIIGFVSGEYQRIQQQGWVLAYTRCWHKIIVQVGTVVSERLVHFSLHLQAEGVRYLFSNRLQHPLPCSTILCQHLVPVYETIQEEIEPLLPPLVQS